MLINSSSVMSRSFTGVSLRPAILLCDVGCNVPAVQALLLAWHTESNGREPDAGRGMFAATFFLGVTAFPRRGSECDRIECRLQ